MADESEEFHVKKTVSRRQIMLLVTMSLANFVNSMSMGYSSPAIPQLENDPSIKTTVEQVSWVAAILPFGAIFGSIVASLLVDWIGPKYILSLTYILFTGSWSCTALSSSILILIGARFIAGLCIGMSVAAGSVYAAETVQKDFRPLQGIFFGVSGTFGMFLMTILVTMLDWRGLAWAGAIVSLPTLLIFVYLPESPYYLHKHSPAKSKEAFKWILVSDRESKEKFDEMKKSLLDMTNSNSKNDSMFSKVNMYPTLVLVALHTFQQFTGINVFIFFATNLFIRISEPHAETFAMLMSIVNVLSNLISSYFLGYNKRNYMLRLSTRTVVPCLWILASFFIMKDLGLIGGETSLIIALIPSIALMSYIFFFSIGWGPIPFVFMMEGLPSTIRGNASGIGTAVNFGTAFFVTKSFSWLSDYIGYGWIFFIYSIFTGVGGILLERYMPETLGKSVGEVDAFYYKLRHKD